MANVRVDRMMKELQAEPSLQFFEWMLDVALPGRDRRGADLAPIGCVVAAHAAKRAQAAPEALAMVHFDKAA